MNLQLIDVHAVANQTTHDTTRVKVDDFNDTIVSGHEQQCRTRSKIERPRECEEIFAHVLVDVQLQGIDLTVRQGAIHSHAIAAGRGKDIRMTMIDRIEGYKV